MSDGVLLARPDGVIILADAIPVSDHEMRQLDQLLDELGAPRPNPSNDVEKHQPSGD